MKNKFIKSGIFALLLTATLYGCNNGNDQTSKTPTTLPDMANDTTQGTAALSNTSRGREIFQQRCVACHGLNGNYRNNNAADLSVTRADSMTIINTIKNGRGAMPMFGNAIPDSDLAQLELYVKTLRK